MNVRIGHGYDIHRLQTGGNLTVGGVIVAQGMSAIAHSDGDVAIHALVDALLGAAGLGDIGEMFPNTDDAWKNAHSMTFLATAYHRVQQAGFEFVNADITILAERPKLKSFKPKMVETLQNAIGGAINIKAGTNEGCDAIGRGEAIAAHAVVLLPERQLMRILGIDPGLQLTGYGVIDYVPRKPKLVDGGVIRLDAKTSIPHRLVELETELESIIEEHKPDVCAVEQLYSHYKHPRTAILMGHARGVILLVATRRNVRVEQFAANRIKQSLTGHGHASKLQMQRAIQSVWNLKEPPEPPDVADALAVALCCGQFLGRGTAV